MNAQRGGVEDMEGGKVFLCMDSAWSNKLTNNRQ